MTRRTLRSTLVALSAGPQAHCRGGYVRRRAPKAEREARGLRDRLVVNYSAVVKYVAGRISGRMAGPLDQEDVVASGLFGLLNAVETYDPDRRTKFESYAISKIRWSILTN